MSVAAVFPEIESPEWQAQRTALWNRLEEGFMERMTRKELAQFKEYFFSGTLPTPKSYVDLARLMWFPVQTPAGWDYVVRHLVREDRSLASMFHHALTVNTSGGLTPQEDLALWDYLIGDRFQPVVRTRVARADTGQKPSYEVDVGEVFATLYRFFDSWLSEDAYGENPKWIARLDYFLSAFAALKDSDFKQRDGDGNPASRQGYFAERIFTMTVAPLPDHAGRLSPQHSAERQRLQATMRKGFDELSGPPAMKAAWKRIKKQHG